MKKILLPYIVAWLAGFLISDVALPQDEKIAIKEITKIGGKVKAYGTFGAPGDPFPNAAIDVSQSAFTDKHLKLLGNFALIKSVNFSNTTVSGTSLKALLPFKADCELIKLQNTKIKNNDLRHLHPFSALLTLDISHNDINDKGLSHLEKLPRLSCLDISHTSATDRGMKYLMNTHGLSYLNLGYTSIGNNGLRNLGKKRVYLGELDLSGTNVSDPGLVELLSMPNLGKLNLSATNITDRGLQILLRHKNLRTFGEVILVGTKVSTSGVNALRKKAPRMKIEY